MSTWTSALQKRTHPRQSCYGLDNHDVHAMDADAADVVVALSKLPSAHANCKRFALLALASILLVGVELLYFGLP